MRVYSKIKNVGVYLPKRVLTNSDLENIVDTSDEWIVKRTGIKERRIAGPNETNGTMAVEAAKNAIKRAGMRDDQKIDCIICATNTNCADIGEFPCSSSYVQAKLTDWLVGNCPAFDIQQGCAGINYALAVADALIRAYFYRRVLAIGTDKLSAVADFSDRSTCILFGDGATAYIIEASPKRGFVGHRLYADGSRRDVITCPTELRRPIDSEEKVLSPTLRMDGTEVFEFVVNTLEMMAKDFPNDRELNPYGLNFNDVKAILAHQANGRVFRRAAKEIARIKGIGLSAEEILSKFVITIETHGNNSNASQGSGLMQLIDSGELKEGDHILSAGYGANLGWGFNLYRVTF